MKRFISKPNRSGQTILELALVVVGVIGFFVLASYLFSVFDVAQKQTMLSRTQAFIELGNYSNYTTSSHGQDNVQNQNSQVSFQLGENTVGTRVDLEDVENFKKAVEGELSINVTHSVNNDFYWESYRLPKARAKIIFNGEEDSDGGFDIDVSQTLFIVHNRSIKLDNSPFIQGGLNDTGIYSGSLHYNQFIRIAQFGIPTASGLVDNVEALKDYIRDLARQDPSLSLAAADLERSINAADSLAGGAQAALISMAISAAMQFGFEALGDAFEGFSSSGAEAGAEAGATASSGGLFDLASWFDGSPLKGLGDGLSQFGDSLSNFNGLGSIMQMGKGVSQVLNFTGDIMTLTGHRPEWMNYTALLAAPYDLASGLANLETAFNDIGLNGKINVFALSDAFSRVMTPVASVVGTFAPEAGLPLAQISIGLAGFGGIGRMADNLSNIGEGLTTVPESLRGLADFTGNLGGAVAAVGVISGEEDIQLAGSILNITSVGMNFTAKGIEKVAEWKDNGVDIFNPVEMVAEIGKEAVNKVKESIGNFVADAKSAAKGIGDGLDSIFGAGDNLPEGAEGFGTELAAIDKASSGGVDRMLNGFDPKTADIGRVSDRMEDVNGSILQNMQYHGDIESMVAVQEYLPVVQETIGHLQDVRAGDATLDLDLLAKGSEAARGYRQTVENYISENPEAKREIISSRGGGNQRDLERTVIAMGLTKKEAQAAYQADQEMHPIKHAFGDVLHADYGTRVLREQEDKRNDLIIATGKNISEYRSYIEKALHITQATEGIAPTIVTNDQQLVQFSAAEGARFLSKAQGTGVSDRMKARFKAAEHKLSRIADRDYKFRTPKQELEIIAVKFQSQEQLYDDLKAKLVELHQQCSVTGVC